MKVSEQIKVTVDNEFFLIMEEGIVGNARMKSYMWAMTLVHPSQIVTVWDEFVMKNIIEVVEDSADNDGEGDVARDYNLAIESFIKYFEGTWTGLVNSRTGKRKRPKFEHNVWNKFTAIMANENETTNKARPGTLPQRAASW